MSAILALDQGTTSSRAIVFDAEGRARATAHREFEQYFPRPGWVEHDPEEIWSSQIGVAQEALSRAGLKARDLAGIGITNQRETTIVWDRRTGRPIHNAIVWQDRRTADICERLESDGLADLVRERTGLVIDPYFSGTKIKWLLDNVDGARERAEAGDLCFGTVDSWLAWNLTEGELHVTDASNASRSMLFDIHRSDWDDDLLGALGVPREMLPVVVGSSEVVGEVARDLPAGGVPIAGIAGDQHAALFGQRCTRPGMIKNTYGTGCFMLMNTGTDAVRSDSGLLTTLAWRIGDRTEYALEGSVFIAGAVVQWLRDGLGLIRTAAEVEALARKVDHSDGLFLVPAFAGLGAPHWDPHARGTMVGITRGTTDAHVARAALESIALQVADVVDAMRKDAGLPISELRADGGAARNELLMQIQANFLQAPVVRSATPETTALGAAYLAGLATGVWPSQEEIDEHWSFDRRFEPEQDESSVREVRTQWHRAVERSMSWVQ